MVSDVVSLTERLVRVDTAPGRSTNALVALLMEEVAGWGVARVQDGRHAGVPQQNLVVRLGGEGPAALVLAGHIDTVPWRDDQPATTTPFRDGDVVYGRGTCDMKGPVAAQLEAAARMKDALKRPLVLAFTYAEEVGCHGAAQLVSDARLFGDVSQAACIVGEPTGLAPILEHKGYGIVRIELHGVPAHSSDPWAGADASVALGTLLRDLHELREALRREADPDSGHVPPGTTLNTGIVAAGSARNVVPEHAEVSLEVRPVPGHDMSDLRRRIQACVDLATAAAPGVSSSVHWDEFMPPFQQSVDGRLVQWLTDATGREPGAVPFYTEAELYRAGLAMPTVVCGPGSIDKAHRVDESITIDQLEAGVDLYAQAIEAFCT